MSYLDDRMNIEHHFAGGVYAKQALIPAGYIAVQHKHVYPHLSILASGTAEVTFATSFGLIHGPAVMTIPANEHHKVKAITDCVWFCIHATEETDPKKVDELLIVPSSAQLMRELAEEP